MAVGLGIMPNVMYIQKQRSDMQFQNRLSTQKSNENGVLGKKLKKYFHTYCLKI